MKFRYFFSMTAFLIGSAALKAQATAPSYFSFQGRLFMSNGLDPVESPSTQFAVQILSADATCLLYEETYLNDMTGTSGLFSINVGTGTNTHRTALTLPQVFDNSTSKSGYNCAYSPLAGDIRKLRFIYNAGEGSVTLSPDQNMLSVPYALYSSSLEGLGKDDFLKVTAQSTQVKLDALLASSTQLASLAAGTSSLYTKSVDLPVSNGVLDLSSGGLKVPSTPAGPDYAVNKTYADQFLGGNALNVSGLSNGQVLQWDATQQKWKNTSPSLGTLTSVTAGAGLIGGTITTTGTLALDNSGVAAGTYSKVTVDAYGRVTAGASLAESDLPSFTTPGKISGSAITSGTIGGNTAVNTAGAIATTGNISASSVSSTSDSTQALNLYNSGNIHKVTLKTPASVSSDYTLNLPATAGTANQVLAVDGSGNLNWTSVTNPLNTLNVGAPLTLTLTPSASLTIMLATSSTTGIVQLANDGETTAGRAVQGNDARLSNPRAPTGSAGGDLAGTYPTPTVAKIQGVAVSSTTPVSTQVLRYNATSWTPGYLNVTDLKNASGASQIPSNCTGGQTLVYSSGLDQFLCQNISLSISGISGLGTAATLDAPVAGDASSSQVVLGNDSRLTSARAPTGSATGDLSGTYPSPVVAKIQNVSVAAAAPSSDQVLKYNGSSWTPASLGLSDLRSTVGGGLFSSPNCSSTQTLSWSSASDQFSCIGLAISSASQKGLVQIGSGLSVAGGTVSLANVGTAGTTNGIAVDAYGRVTSVAALGASDIPSLDWSKISSGKPTTLSGYGITDSVKNAGGTVSVQQGLDSAKGSASTAGRLYVATDAAKIYRDNGSSWDLMSSAVGSGGTVTGITAGTGLTGGTISTSGTLNVDVGTSAGKIVQLDSNAKLPAVDGSQLTNMPSIPFSNMQVFDATGSFNVPAKVTRIYVQVWGAGGGGGGGSVLLGNGGGGGGSGGYVAGFLTVTASSSLTVTVGTGGAKGTVNNGGGNGLGSSVGSLSAGGGAGGANALITFASGGTASSTLGVVGETGDTALAGNGGGGGRAPNGGPGGRGSPSTTITGFDGTVPGGGGGGGAYGVLTGSLGGAGAGGRIIVWY